MAHAERCPVCNGSGVVNKNQSVYYTGGDEETCHGCNGMGWVTVQDNTYPNVSVPFQNPAWEPYEYPTDVQYTWTVSSG